MSVIWITTEEAARLSGYHPEYVRELARTGKINGQKFGPTWQIDKQSLLDYLEAGLKSDDDRRRPKA